MPRKKFDDVFSCLDIIHERDRQTDSGSRSASRSKKIRMLIFHRIPCGGCGKTDANGQMDFKHLEPWPGKQDVTRSRRHRRRRDKQNN